MGAHRAQSHKLPWHDKEVLERLYIDEDLKQKEIAELFDTRQSTIGIYVRKFGLDRDKPWRDKDKLERLFVEENLEQQEIADMWGCTPMNICRWVKRHGLKRKWRQEDWLREKYHEEGYDMREMADMANTHINNIWRWMEKHGIDRRSGCDRPASLYLSKGYPQWACGVNKEYVKVHRLAAVAWFGFEEVCDMVVHHESNTPWDNREENLTLMTFSEHARLHNKGDGYIEEAKARQADQ